jgi:hypothetical protein
MPDEQVLIRWGRRLLHSLAARCAIGAPRRLCGKIGPRARADENVARAADVAEMALAHTITSKVEAAYRRGDLFLKRWPLMDAWARFCNSPQSTGEVVPIRAAAGVLDH